VAAGTAAARTPTLLMRIKASSSAPANISSALPTDARSTCEETTMKRLRSMVIVPAVMTACMLAVGSGGPLGAQEKPAADASPLQKFVSGAPSSESPSWTLAAGGRIYDTWWDALDRTKPKETNPAYPKTGTRSGANTWRCVECHGWDYKGKDGVNGRGQPMGERYTGIVGIRAARKMSTAAIVQKMRAPPHNYSSAMITDEEMRRLAAFVRSGQHDADRHIDRATGRVRGNIERGKAIFQTVCAACHGFDGRALNWGSAREPGYIGTEAKKLPWEVLHKIRNSHPGAAMVNLRALSLEDAVATLAYAQTLPSE
jgi:mono/diheme cytochrome c family protein